MCSHTLVTRGKWDLYGFFDSVHWNCQVLPWSFQLGAESAHQIERCRNHWYKNWSTERFSSLQWQCGFSLTYRIEQVFLVRSLFRLHIQIKRGSNRGLRATVYTFVTQPAIWNGPPERQRLWRMSRANWISTKTLNYKPSIKPRYNCERSCSNIFKFYNVWPGKKNQDMQSSLYRLQKENVVQRRWPPKWDSCTCSSCTENSSSWYIASLLMGKSW